MIEALAGYFKAWQTKNRVGLAGSSVNGRRIAMDLNDR